MKEHPILFSAPMVRAIFDGRKTMTRRIFKGLTPPDCGGVHSCVIEDGFAKFHLDGKLAMHNGEWTECPYGQPGDQLWVKETFCDVGINPEKKPEDAKLIYAADGKTGYAWKPSIFMPRWASRITLQITGVRVERLQDISEEDAKSEGIDDAYLVQNHLSTDRVLAYRYLWEDINGAGSWSANPWVWVIEFHSVTHNTPR